MFDYTREVLRQFFWDARHRLSIFPKESRERILVVQEEGLGNSILTIPLIQALFTLESQKRIDVLVNRAKGSDFVFEEWPLVNRVWDKAEFDLLTSAVHYHTIIECHPRHELSKNVKYQHRKRIGIRIKPGLDYHWHFTKHETEYLLDMAREMGFKGPVPALRRLKGDSNYDFDWSDNMIAIGIGYYKGLRADGRDWSDRHWGNENFLELCERLKKLGFRPILVGDQKDFERDGAALAQQGVESICGKLSLKQVIHFLSRCRAFIGNDTGLMHVSASQNIITVGIFVSTNSIKSYPLGANCVALGGHLGKSFYKIPIDEVIESFENLMGIS